MDIHRTICQRSQTLLNNQRHPFMKYITFKLHEIYLTNLINHQIEQCKHFEGVESAHILALILKNLIDCTEKEQMNSFAFLSYILRPKND